MAGGARSYRLPGVAAGSGAGHVRHRRHSGWPGTGRARSRRPVRIPPADLAFREGIQRDRPQQNARRAREQLSPNARPASMTFWRGPSGSRKDRIMPTGKSSMQGKICMVTGANSGIGKATALALAQMGAAVVLFTYELARRLEGTGVTVNCLHPGFVATHFGQRDAGPAFRLLVKVIGSFGTSPQEGAKTSIYLASSPKVEGVTGNYFVKSIPKRSAAISYDESLQRHLWEQSAKLVNL